MQSECYIGGRWQAARSQAMMPVVNPATEEVISYAAAGQGEDIDLAVIAARAAIEGPWGNTTGRERAVYLRAIANAIRSRRECLARLEVLDNGKPHPEALWDIDDTVGCFEYYAGLAEELDGDDLPIPLPDDRFRSSVQNMPVGVAGLIIPWNYPLLMAAWKVAPALAAGCTTILKPSELTPFTSLELAKIADEAGLPPGVLNVVTGFGAEAGAALSQHRDVDKLAFTGSVATGRKVMAAAASDIKKISLELGGKSPIIVFDDAELDAAVQWIMFGIFWNQGQVCSATSRLIVEENIAPRLIERLVAEAQDIRIGNGLDEDVLLGPLINAPQHAKVMGYIDRARKAGATVLTGGKRPAHLDRGYFLEPTILMTHDHSSEAWREEIFGPVLCVRTFRTEAEALHLANDSDYGLAAAVMSADSARCERIAKAFKAGVVWINCSQPTFVQAPWGGVKKSGIGRELGRWGLESFLEKKQVTSFVSGEPWGWYPRASDNQL